MSKIHRLNKYKRVKEATVLSKNMISITAWLTPHLVLPSITNAIKN